MKLGILALDYDGTVATHGALVPAVRAAIDEARGQGIIVVLVTGRILDDLRRVAGDLRFLDAVVAENGAVLAFPASGRSQVLGQPPPPAFRAALDRRGIPTECGEVVVEADAVHAAGILTVVREQQQPLALLFNGGRLMVLPQGITKASGLREVLRILRLSEHNTVGVGDAENDHALLAACEIGAAVAWGSAALQAAADQIIEGDGPAAVAPYIRRLIARPVLPLEGLDRHRVVVGHVADGAELSVATGASNTLIAGDPRSGKSWLAGLLCEQLILRRYCVCVVDPEGDYRPLQALPGVLLLGGEDPPPRPHEVARALRHPDASVVIDLSHVPHPQKRHYVAALLTTLAGLRRQTGLPHRIVIDEAHYFLHEPAARMLLDLDLAGYVLITYRMSEVRPEVLATCQTVLATRITDPREAAALQALYGEPTPQRAWAAAQASLSLGEAMLFPARHAPSSGPDRFRLAPRLSPHVRHRQKYLDTPVAEHHAFVFTGTEAAPGRRAQTLTEFCAAMADCSATALDAHLGRSDFSRWIADVFGDHLLAAQFSDVERQYRLGQILDARDRMTQLVEERYVLAEMLPKGGPAQEPERVSD